MAALGRISKLRHVVAGAAVAGTTTLTALGVIGDGSHPERFETWQTIIEPAGGEALRITETWDHDFGDNERHGPQRVIPNDFGRPSDVVASSPDAPADVHVIDEGFETVIRIGDPDRIVTGQNRYVLSYVLPEARLSSGTLAVDAIAGDQFETDVAEVVVRGFELENPRCFVGSQGSEERCEIVEEDGVYRATIEPLPEFTGLTVDGRIVRTTEIVDVAPLPQPERRTDNRLARTLAVAALGTAGATGVYVWARRRGRNEVYAGGAADAAYGSLPAPLSAADGSDRATTLVPDDDLGDLATIEFVPPKGVEPWEAAVLLRERVDDDTVEAWFAGLAGREAIELSEQDGKLTIASGPRRSQLDAHNAALLDAVLRNGDPYVTGTYDAGFATAWKAVAKMQRERIARSGWWKHLPPGAGIVGSSGGSRQRFGIVAMIAFVALWAGSAATAVLGLFSSVAGALFLGLAFPVLIALFVYRVLLPARSAQGSALALRTESFRRFLHASEAQHVEWAWERGLLREYSGWAVALGEADAWERALERANVPEPARVSAMPAILIAHSSSIHSSRTPPSSSGSSSGGGFSGGGSVGGGGGGGSRGSW